MAAARRATRRSEHIAGEILAGDELRERAPHEGGVDRELDPLHLGSVEGDLLEQALEERGEAARFCERIRQMGQDCIVAAR